MRGINLRMAWWQRYFNIFEGEPAWVFLLVTVLLLAGGLVVAEKLVRLSAWILAISLVAAGLLFAIYCIFFW